MLLANPLPLIITYALIALIAMDVHEFAHAYVAYRMGDTTARDMGRMTLNPFVNLYLPGWLMWAFFGFGILGSAPVDPRRMKDPRWGELAAVAAGPFANLLLAAVFALIFRLNLLPFPTAFREGQILPTLPQLAYFGVSLNITFFLFNLLPFFPFDGWRIMLRLVPPDLAYTLQRHQQTSTIIFFACFALSALGVFNVFGAVLGPPSRFLMELLIGY